MESITFGSLFFEVTAYAGTIEYQVLLLQLILHVISCKRFDIFPSDWGMPRRSMLRCESLVLYRMMYGNWVMEVQRRNNFVVGSLKLSPGVIMVFVGVMVE